MPYKKTYKKRTRKSYSKKRKSYSSYTQQAVGPSTLTRKLRYVDKITLNPASLSALASHRFRANDMYDPDVTGTGHQPMGFDQYMTMYDHFKVVGSKITCHILGNEDAASPPFVIGVYLDDDTTAVTDSNNLIEQGLTSYKIVSTGNGQHAVKLYKNFSSKKYFSSQKAAATLMGDASTSPTEQAIYTIFAQALENSVDVLQLRVHVVIDYIVQFSERKTLTSS